MTSPIVAPERPVDAPTLSPSRAGDFLTCPLLYRFRVLDQLPEPPSLAATRGTVVHTVLERLYDLPASERTPGSAAALVEPVWREMLDDDPELLDLADGDPEESLTEWVAQARRLVARYFALEDPSTLEPAERELYVAAEVASGLWLHGYVDRLDVSPAGDIRVVDYKTGRAPSPGFEARPMFQLQCYALVLWHMTGTLPRVLQLMYLGSDEVLRYEPDEADLRATQRKLTALWRAIARASETGDWRARKGPLCGWCAHQSLCPEWGGTPPPLPVASGTQTDPETGDFLSGPRTPPDEV